MVSEKRIYWLSKAFGLGKQCKCPTVQGVGPKSGEWSRRCYAGHRRLDSKPAKPVESSPYTRLCGNKEILTVNGEFPGPNIESS
ncbi:hypothetical protein QUC31_014943 [Theobroma cacao]